MTLVAVLVLLAVLAGAAVACQAGVNAVLARGVGGPVPAALVSFAVGTLVLVAFVLLSRDGLPAREAVAALPAWAWTGGVLGAFFVAFATFAAPRLGAGVLITSVVAGQLAAAVALDHFGWIGFEQRTATLGRLLGVALLFAGVAFVRFG